MMKIVIPVFKHRVSPVFDWCSNLLLIEIQSGLELGRIEIAAAYSDPIQLANRLVEMGVDIAVCGGIGETLAALLEARKIQLISGVSGEVCDVLVALNTGELSDPRFLMPGFPLYHGQRRLHGVLGGKGPKHGSGNGRLRN